MATIDLNQMAPVVQPLVMNNERGRSWLALFNAELEEQRSNRYPPSAAAQPPVVAPVAPLAQQEELEESMAVDTDADQSMVSLDSSLVTPQQPRRTRLERLRQEVAALPPVEPEPSIDVVLGSQPWHSDVPQVIALK